MSEDNSASNSKSEIEQMSDPTHEKNRQSIEIMSTVFKMPKPLAKQSAPEKKDNNDSAFVPQYIPPSWTGQSPQMYSFEVLKNGTIIGVIDLNEKDWFLVGRIPMCDVSLEHPSISRQHAVIQRKNTGEIFVYDLGSTHGTKVNKQIIEPKKYHKLHVGDLLKFGDSTRLYILTGPQDEAPEREIPSAPQPVTRKDQIKQFEKHSQEYLQRFAEAEKQELEPQAPKIDEPPKQTEEPENAEDEDGFPKRKSRFDSSKILASLENEADEEEVYDPELVHLRPKKKKINKKPGRSAVQVQQDASAIRRQEEMEKQKLDEEEEASRQAALEDLDPELAQRTVKYQFDAREWDEEEDQDDEFYDRTKVDSPSIVTKSKKENETSLMRKKRLLESDIANIRRQLDKVTSSSNSGSNADDMLDSYMESLNSTLKDEQQKKLSAKLGHLNAELAEVEKLLNVSKSALTRTLPSKLANSVSRTPLPVVVPSSSQAPSTANPTSAPLPTPPSTVVPKDLKPPAVKPAIAKKRKVVAPREDSPQFDEYDEWVPPDNTGLDLNT